MTEFDRGYNDALDLLENVILQMKASDYDLATLDELKQRMM